MSTTVTARHADEFATFARELGLEVERETSQYGQETMVATNPARPYSGYVQVIVGQPMYAGRRPRIAAYRYYGPSAIGAKTLKVSDIRLYLRMLAGQ